MHVSNIVWDIRLTDKYLLAIILAEGPFKVNYIMHDL
jgi:hypothetical protein